MLGVTVTEWIGYMAMAALLISFMMKNIKTLRIINTVGCMLFVIYGYLLGSWPIMITNVSITLINIYYLFLKKEE